MIVLKYLYSLYSAIIFGTLMVISTIYYFFVYKVFRSKNQKYAINCNRRWGKIWAFLTGIRISYKDAHKLDKNIPYVIVANHGSMFDAILTVVSLKTVFMPLVKIEVGKIPLMGFMFKQASIMVDRKDPESRKQSMVKLKETGEKNISVLLFPEGTRNMKRDLPMRKVHNGAFRIAIELQRPMFPVVYIGARDLMNNEKLPIKPCKVLCVYGDPVPTAGLTQEDLPALKAKVTKIMEDMIRANDPVFQNV